MTTQRKTKAAALSIASNSILVTAKTFIGIFSGSVSVIAEAIHSSLDLLASIIAFFGVRTAGKPADGGHPYGHGKWENVSGTAEALLIFIAAIWIVYEAVNKIIEGSAPEMLELGIAAMALSVLMNVLVSRYLKKVARETDSVALEADASHLTTDVLTSLGVLIGLLLVRITGLEILDPVVAIIVAVVILKAAVDILLKSFSGIVDSSLPHEELSKITSIISRHTQGRMPHNDLKTRKAGSNRFVDFHLEATDDISSTQILDISKLIKEDLKHEVGIEYVNIHWERPNDNS